MLTLVRAGLLVDDGEVDRLSIGSHRFVRSNLVGLEGRMTMLKSPTRFVFYNIFEQTNIYLNLEAYSIFFYFT